MAPLQYLQTAFDYCAHRMLFMAIYGLRENSSVRMKDQTHKLAPAPA